MSKLYNFSKETCLFIVAIVCLMQSLQAQTTTQNYIQTRVPRREIKTEAKLDVLTPSKDSVLRTIQYIDGLGRSLQSIDVKGNPDGTKDVVQQVTYDEFGRNSRSYLPFSYSGTPDGSYKSDAISKQGAFYYPIGSTQPSGAQQSNKVVYNKQPYTQTFFEPSPLNRVTEQGAAGEVWQPAPSRTNAQGRTVVIEHTFNDQSTFSSSTSANTGSRKVTWYAVNNNGTLIQGGNSFYNSNQLHVTVTKDENWTQTNGCFGTTEEYKNKEGQIILKRTYNINVGPTPTAEMLSTYYVYNDLGNLAYVLPPKSNADNLLPTQTMLENVCYQYRYDERNRLTQKKLPGKGWEYMIYNTLDQVVMTQDANQRLTNQWTVTKYDAIGRIIITGLCSFGSVVMPLATLQTEVYTHPQWDTRDNTNAVTGYTNVCYPSSINVLNVNYYDNYTNISGLPTSYKPAAGTYTTMTKNLLTATRTAVLNTISNATPDYLWTANYYDDNGRNIKSFKQHYLGGTVSPNNYDEITSTYNFADQVISNNRKHYTNTGGTPVLAVTIANTYEYDHIGRRVNTFEQIITPTNTGNNILISKNDYNEIGQLKTKHLHSATGTAPFLQDIDYAYNERGWLSTINDPTVAATPNKLFSEELRYNNPETGASPQFNGNIAQMKYLTTKETNPGLRSFKYSYDQVRKLVNAAFTGGLSNDALDEQVSYDMGGNIMSLTRTGLGSAGSLAYIYTGNQLTTVTGYSPRSYNYDQNGNATSNGMGKDISYNLLNLPQLISQSGTPIATYYYDAAGNKLRNTGNDGARDYIDGIVYHNNVLEFIATEDGRAVPASSNSNVFTYEYNLQDHLGSNRVMIDNFNNAGRVVQEDEYYSFGLQKQSGGYYFSLGNRYLYNGKEIQVDLPNQYDYGARFYDPVIARWSSVDPLAEKSRRISPYVYCDNNPIGNIDPDGMVVLYGYGVMGGDLYTGDDARSYLADVKQKGGGKGKKNNETKPSAMNRYLKSLWENSKDYDVGQQIGQVWQGWTGEHSTLPEDAKNVVKGIFGVLTPSYWQKGYNDAMVYINAEPEEKGRMDAGVINETLVGIGSAAPIGEFSAIAKNSAFNAINVGLNEGNGYNFKYKTTTVSVMYGNGETLGSTLVSMKGSKGGNMLRFDYGGDHGAFKTMGFHSHFRFKIKGSTYGSTAQYPIAAPFVFWKYKKDK